MFYAYKAAASHVSKSVCVPVYSANGLSTKLSGLCFPDHFCMFVSVCGHVCRPLCVFVCVCGVWCLYVSINECEYAYMQICLIA